MDHNAKTAIAIIATLVLAVGAEILLISRSSGAKAEKPAMHSYAIWRCKIRLYDLYGLCEQRGNRKSPVAEFFYMPHEIDIQ